MANKKKTSYNRANRNKGEVKTVKKLTEEEINAQNKKTIKELIIITVVIALIFGIIYLLTIGAGRLGWFDTHYTKPDVEEATISYDNIALGTVLNRSESDYYVVLADMKDNSMHISAIIDTYKNKENAKTLYVVDLSDGLNKSAISDTSNLIVENISDLRVNDTTLLEIKNHKIVNAFVGTDNIEDILK